MTSAVVWCHVKLIFTRAGETACTLQTKHYHTYPSRFHLIVSSLELFCNFFSSYSKRLQQYLYTVFQPYECPQKKHFWCCLAWSFGPGLSFTLHYSIIASPLHHIQRSCVRRCVWCTVCIQSCGSYLWPVTAILRPRWLHAAVEPRTVIYSQPKPEPDLEMAVRPTTGPCCI